MIRRIRNDSRKFIPFFRDLICAAISLFETAGSWGPRINHEFEVVYFPAGTNTTYLSQGQTFKLDEPCFIFTPPNVEHTYFFDSDKPTRHMFVHFILNLKETTALRDIPAVIKSEGLHLIPQLLKQIIYLASTKPTRYNERITSLLWATIEELVSVTNPKSLVKSPHHKVPLQIIKTLQFIEEHLVETIDIKSLAAITGWTHEHFTRMFVQTQGISPKQYILHRRIDRACELLKHQNTSIKEIAFEVGFQSEQYFCRAFSKKIGSSASNYRKQYAEPLPFSVHLAPTTEIAVPYPLNRHVYS